VGHREAAAVGLGAGLAELRSQFGGIGHGEARAVEQEDAVAVPEFRGVGGVEPAAAAGDGGEQALEEAEGQPAAGLAVGGIGEVQPGEVAEQAAGAVAVQDLLDKEQGGGQRGEGALAVVPAEVAADREDQGGG